jgi:polysaccharide deacetylase family protein (PEP-CTERM system associated)
MGSSFVPAAKLGLTRPLARPPQASSAPVILSFDVEEHFRIEAGAHLPVDSGYRAHCCQRLDETTRWLLDQLGEHGIQATFFIVGQVARHNPALVRAIADAGHEVASHGWDHQRVHRFTPQSFRKDLRQSRDVLTQVSGQPVLGYRAPTFSIVRQTAWALDVIAEEGFLYDSSIYPVRHDRYGVPDAPRSPFRARGYRSTVLELPPVTLRVLGMKAPMGGGGYFRLFPLFMTRWAIRQTLSRTTPPVAMLYFHPWEFDPDQLRLPLGRFSGWRTYVGIGKTRDRLAALFSRHLFARAVDVAREIGVHQLPLLDVGNDEGRGVQEPGAEAGALITAVNRG